MRVPVVSALKLERYRYLLLAGALVLGADQLTKYIVRSTLVVGESVPEDSPVRITYIQNTGSAFGLFTDQTLVLTIAAVIGTLIIVYFFLKGAGVNTLLGLSLTLQIAGAIGNIIDRIAYGHVVDFIDFRVWPIFNVADSSITIGFVILALVLVFGRDKTGRAKDATST